MMASYSLFSLVLMCFPSKDLRDATEVVFEILADGAYCTPALRQLKDDLITTCMILSKHTKNIQRTVPYAMPYILPR